MKANRFLNLGWSLLMSGVIVSALLWGCGYSPLTFAQVLIENTWMSSTGVLLLLTKTSLMILTGLAVVIPYRAGLFNIGGEGQFLLGGLAAAVVGAVPLAGIGFGHWMLCLGVGMVVGSFWAAIAAWFRTRRNVHEVIVTIMLNFIAFEFVNQVTYEYFSAGKEASRTPYIMESAHLPLLFRWGNAHTSIGIVLACLIAVGFSLWLSRTWGGFSVRAVGTNPRACTYAGFSVGKVHGWSLILGGACAGLAGAIETTGISHTFYGRFTGGTGFDGIAVAFLALCEPWATIPAALMIATLRVSDRALQFEMGIPKEVVFMVEGILIICIAIFTRRQRHD